jgi:hypothetical protein
MPSNITTNVTFKVEKNDKMVELATRKLQGYTLIDSISKSFEVWCHDKEIKVINNNFVMQ